MADPFLNTITSQDELNRAIRSAFDNYANPLPGSWFERMLPDKDDSNINAIKENNGAIQENTEANKSTSEALNNAVKTGSVVTLVMAGQNIDDKDELFAKLGVTAQDVIDKLGEGFNVLYDGLMSTRGIISEISQPHMEFFDSVQRSLGGLKDVTKESTIGLSQDLSEAYQSFASDFHKTNEELNSEENRYLMRNFELTSDEQMNNLLNQTNQVMALVDDPKKAFETFAKIISSTGDTYGRQVTSQFKNFSQELFVIQEGLGLSTDQMTKIITRSIDTTGEASMETFDNIVKLTLAAEKSTGISSKVIADGFAKMKTDVQTFGNVTDEEAIRISTNLLQMGVSVEGLGQMINKFTNFDGAAQSIGNLTAAFGVHMDAMEMMTLANTDQEAFLMRIREQFEEQGVAFEDMNLAQQKLLSQQIGLGIEETSRLLDFDREITSIEDLQAASEEMDQNEAIDRMKDNISDLISQGASLESAIAKSKAFGLGADFSAEVVEANKKVRELEISFGSFAARAQKKISSEVIETVADGAKNVQEMIDALNSKINEANNKSSKISEAQIANAEAIGIVQANANTQVQQSAAEGIGTITGNASGAAYLKVVKEGLKSNEAMGLPYGASGVGNVLGGAP